MTSEYPKKGFPHGGVGTVIQTLARGMVGKGQQVSVIGLNYTKNKEVDNDQGVKIYRYTPKHLKPVSWYLNFKTINRAILQLHQKQPIDIIESTELGFAFANKITGVQYLIRMHGGHHFFAESEQRQINFWKGFQEKRSFKKADHVIGVSDYVVQHTLKYINFKSKLKGVIYNIANLERFKPDKTSIQKKGRVFFAGSLCEKKGIRQLIKAMAKVISTVPEAHLVVAGRDTKIRGTQKSYLEYLKTEIDPRIEHKITFLGNVENAKLNSEIDKAEVCVYPSHMEAMPLAWLEVLSMGKALVGSRLGPGPEIINHESTGLLCNPFDIEALSEFITELLTDRNKAQYFGKNAQKDINERFNTEKLLKENLKLYSSLIKN